MIEFEQKWMTLTNIKITQVFIPALFWLIYVYSHVYVGLQLEILNILTCSSILFTDPVKKVTLSSSDLDKSVGK